MSVIIPDSRFEMPSLLEGRKPTGEVKIDWDHPLSKGLQKYIPLLKNSTDLISNNASVDNSISYPLANFNGTDSYIDLGSNGFQLGSSDFSITVKVKSLNTVDRIVILGTGNLSSTDGGYNLERTADGNIMFSYFDGSFPSPELSGASTIGDGDWHIVTVSWKADNSYRYLYFDGALVNSNSGETNTGIDRNTPLIVGARGQTDGSYTELFSGGITDIIFHSKALSAQEISSLHENPYQFLIPK